MARGMNLKQTVAAMVEKMGSANIEELWQELKADFTRLQIKNAMKGARDDGLIHSLGRVPKSGRGHGAGSLGAPHYPGPKPAWVTPVKPAAPGVHIRPPASVWELAHGRQLAKEWPPRSDCGRLFMLLSSTDDASEAAA